MTKSLSLMKSAVDSANVLSHVGMELSFQLPIRAWGHFIEMFRRLDNEVEKRYCYFWSTLDEVFLLFARGVGEHGRGHEKEQPVEEKKNFDNDNVMKSKITICSLKRTLSPPYLSMLTGTRSLVSLSFASPLSLFSTFSSGSDFHRISLISH